MTQAEAAGLLGVSAVTVQRRLCRSVRRPGGESPDAI
jgi:hypothetical protein